MAVSPDGDFVVVWNSFYGDVDNAMGVEQQIYFGPLQ